MAYTNLEAVNEILVDSNEVPLSAVNFSNAVGVQKAARNYINKAYLEIVGKDVEWPFLAAAASNTSDPFSGNVNFETVAGTRWYQLKSDSTTVAADYSKVDWESFYLTTNGVDGETSPYVNQNLPYTDYNVWARYLREHENNDATSEQTYGQPNRVTHSIDGRFVGLSPIPKQAYKVYFSAWLRPTRLTTASQVILIPDEYIPVLLNRANYYLLHWKKDFQEADRVNIIFQSGIRQMERALIGNPNTIMRDDRIPR
jgi:hypothetical protein